MHFRDVGFYVLWSSKDNPEIMACEGSKAARRVTSCGSFESCEDVF